MYASPFQYHRAGSIAEARQLLAAHPGAKLLAGGHSLLPLMKLRLANPEALIDIGSIAELKGITATQDGFRIGAATPHAAIAASSHLATGCAVVNETAGRIGDPAVRNRGTIGGSLAHADPGADLHVHISVFIQRGRNMRQILGKVSYMQRDELRFRVARKHPVARRKNLRQRRKVFAVE